MYNKYIKRILDFLFAFLALIILSPVFLAVSILVRLKNGSPVLFSQKRVTIEKKVFEIKKFRTMTEEKDLQGNYLPDSERVTYLGKILRSTSLDELPEIVEILKGNLSIIGPRPLPVSYNDFYTENEKSRFSVRAGLIPPEVLYNNVQPTWDEQLGYEAHYAENVSFILDLKILFAVFKGLFLRYNKDYGEYVREALNVERSKVMEEV
ncbi:MAG: sugar transferase [Clostridia bacterium]|nr:sugar transferase [Clostridia bacterium]